MNEIVKGKQSLLFLHAPRIVSASSVVGSKESEGPLRKLFDRAEKDDLFGAQTWEEAESTMQKEACMTALRKAGISAEEIRYLFGGDLLRQGIATSMGVEDFQIPMFGLYGACSTSGEALALAAMSASAGYGRYMMAVTSSHFGSAEKEFRFPLGYANQRPLSAQWTVTGSGAFVVAGADVPPEPESGTKREPESGTKREPESGTKREPESGTTCEPESGTKHEPGAPGRDASEEERRFCHVRISGITVGKIVDYGLKDSQNMGACMAPAAMDTISRNFEDMGRSAGYYDRIITGDLGYIGSSILTDLLKGQGHDIRGRHLDCGMTVFDRETQDTHAGGSGCGCAAVTLAAYVLPKIESGEWGRVLFVPTGALMSTVSFNEGASVPGIAHGIVLEHF